MAPRKKPKKHFEERLERRIYIARKLSLIRPGRTELKELFEKSREALVDEWSRLEHLKYFGIIARNTLPRFGPTLLTTSTHWTAKSLRP